MRRSGREAEGTPLLRVQARKTGFGGSNPPFSATTEFWPSNVKALILSTLSNVLKILSFFSVDCLLDQIEIESKSSKNRKEYGNCPTGKINLILRLVWQKLTEKSLCLFEELLHDFFFS